MSDQNDKSQLVQHSNSRPRLLYPGTLKEVKSIRKRLISEIEDILGNLEDDIKQKPDQILERLNNIKAVAEEHNIQEIPRISVFSILKYKLEELPERVKKSNYVKRQIESPFRTAKIEALDYQALQDQKLQDNTFLVYPNLWGKGFKTYHWGNGFNEDDHNDFRKINYSKQKYSYALEYVNYEETVHEVNRIFFQGLRNNDKDIWDLVRKFQFFCQIIFIITFLMILTVYRTDSSDIQTLLYYISLASAVFVCASEVYSGAYKFYRKPKNQTEIQKITEDIQEYFNKINKLILKDNSIQHKYQWSCPEGCLYLQVKFLNQIPII